jgi:hypothetical protein
MTRRNLSMLLMMMMMMTTEIMIQALKDAWAR